MFKPTSFRSISRGITNQRQPFSGTVPRRSLFTGPRQTKIPGSAATAAAVKRCTATLTVAGLLGGFVLYQLSTQPVVQTEVAAPPVEDLKSKLSIQHVQVQNSLENPGVYVWGNNADRVVAPDSNEDLIKNPRRIAAFNNVLLRDLKLDLDIGVAVDEKGDILQWGIAYALDIKAPEKTLAGKNITAVEISKDRVFALSKDGKVYSMPISKQDQTEGAKMQEFSWLPGLDAESKISYRLLKPKLGYFERVSKIASGRDHIILLTNEGRVFSAAASYSYPTKGQLGIPDLIFATRPLDRPYDTCHELTTLKGFKITQIAAGDYHSLVLDDAGRVFSFGDNTSGQLGFDYNPEANHIPVPTLLPIQTICGNKTTAPTIKNIFAGGANSYFLVDATDTETSRASADLYACGAGIWGNLGNGRWTHVQGTPTKVKALSGLFEYDDKSDTVVPIRLSSLSVGATHSSATMQNMTNVNASTSAASLAYDVNYGSDVLWWGNNEFYQLGTGKRNNTNVPVYIPPLDPVAAAMDTGQGRMTGSSSTKDTHRKSGTIGGKGDETRSARFERKDQVHRFQATPKKKINVGGRNVDVEQRIVCGRGNSAVYSAICM